MNVEALANTRIMHDEGTAYLTLPRTMLELPFKPMVKGQPSLTSNTATSGPDQHADDFIDSLVQLVETLLQDG